MKRNQGVECIRGLAIIMMLFYHYTKLIGNNLMGNGVEPIINEGICQMALILFFVISGYGTYKYISTSQNKCLNGNNYIKKRLKKLIPFYYTSILIIVLTTRTNMLGKKGIIAIIVNCLFLQNIFEDYNCINGVTWTIALMVQFYMFAFPLYKCIKWNKYITYMITLLACTTITRILCGYVELNNLPIIYAAYIHMRQIFTTLDAFVIGMLVASIPSIKNRIRRQSRIILILVALIGSQIAFVLLVFWAGGEYGSGIKYLAWKPVLCLFAAGIIYLADGLSIERNKGFCMFKKIIQFVAKYELGIYIWHVILINNVTGKSDFFEYIKAKNPWLLLLIMISLIIPLGAGYVRLVEHKRE